MRQPRYRVTIVATAASIVSMRKKLRALAEDKDGLEARVRKIEASPSRADRLDDAVADLASAKDDVECLKEELEDWKSNLPENMQDGDKASQLDDAISELETVASSIESAIDEAGSVSFPSMMG
jgi:chromosome segregation ATPase